MILEAPNTARRGSACPESLQLVEPADDRTPVGDTEDDDRLPVGVVVKVPPQRSVELQTLRMRVACLVDERSHPGPLEVATEPQRYAQRKPDLLAPGGA